MDGQQYQGESNVTKTPPWWEIGGEYEVNTTQDAKRIGGHKLSFVRPPMQHTGGSPFPQQNTSQTQAPQYGQQTVSAPQQPQQPQTAYGGAAPKQETPNVPTKDDFRQALIVSQTSMKVAGEYIPTLTEPEKVELMSRLGTEEDIVAAFAAKIAKETYTLAYTLLQQPPF